MLPQNNPSKHLSETKQENAKNPEEYEDTNGNKSETCRRCGKTCKYHTHQYKNLADNENHRRKREWNEHRKPIPLGESSAGPNTLKIEWYVYQDRQEGELATMEKPLAPSRGR